ncbi:Eaa1 [Klebsiella pneumoniae]|uniref:DUF551 domain-containing protein n=1 Tax=Klebsiella pneumoniae TaxID=573 RepID=UPI000E2D7B6F|nr:Eaa1 [Klebsiella pneumoniae]
MTSKFSIDNRELLQRISSGEAVVGIDFGNLIVRELAAFRLAAMDSEPVAVTGNGLNVALSLTQMQIDWICNTCASIYNTRNDDVAQGYINEIRATLERLAAMDSESGCLPLDYLQGHKDGLEWAAQLAEANHPETGDWLYDDPIELAKAIRKGPDMPPAQPVADSEPVIVVGDDGGDALSYRRLIQSFEPGTKLYRHAQPELVVPELRVDWQENEFSAGWNACRAAMLAAAPHDTPALNSIQSVDTVADRWIPVSERMPEVGVKVLCFPAEDEPIHAVFNGQLWLQDVSWSGSEEPIDNVIPVTVTHWMPLPAGPQEVR